MQDKLQMLWPIEILVLNQCFETLARLLSIAGQGTTRDNLNGLLNSLDLLSTELLERFKGEGLQVAVKTARYFLSSLIMPVVSLKTLSVSALAGSLLAMATADSFEIFFSLSH